MTRAIRCEPNGSLPAHVAVACDHCGVRSVGRVGRENNKQSPMKYVPCRAASPPKSTFLWAVCRPRRNRAARSPKRYRVSACKRGGANIVRRRFVRNGRLNGQANAPPPPPNTHILPHTWARSLPDSKLSAMVTKANTARMAAISTLKRGADDDIFAV